MEYARICELLGRRPNSLELELFGVMWSEHCSYKNTRGLLRRLPVDGPRVVQGPGENEGAIRVGRRTIVFKIESHNHPSFIAPFHGAATGVGGILRDIFTMGARPVAVLDSMRFGKLDGARQRELLDGEGQGWPITRVAWVSPPLRRRYVSTKATAPIAWSMPWPWASRTVRWRKV